MIQSKNPSVQINSIRFVATSGSTMALKEKSLLQPHCHGLMTPGLVLSTQYENLQQWLWEWDD